MTRQCSQVAAEGSAARLSAAQVADPQVLEITPLTVPPDASVRLPGSKSITNRAIICAALASGDTTIQGALFADDTEAMAAAVEVLGARVQRDPTEETLFVKGVGGVVSPEVNSVIDARMSGTTGRFVLPVAAMSQRPVIVDGQPQLRSRPFGSLVAALRALGVAVEEPATGESLPLRVCGPVRSREVTVAVDCSSQFISGLMLAAPLAPDGLTLRLGGEAVSRPYLEMTARVMTSFGASVTVQSDIVTVAGGGYRSPGHYRVEPDASSASYFWAAAAVTGGTVRVQGLGNDSIQGDTRFVSVLEQMGATVGSVGSDLVVRGGSLKGVDVDLRAMSDTAVTLAVVASLASGRSRVSGIGFIRHKESDRIAAVVTELRRCGVDARELADGFVVSPVCPPGGALIRTYDDHRIAMAFAVLGLVVPGIRIERPECVAKTFPVFFQMLEGLRVNTSADTETSNSTAARSNSGGPCE